MEALCRKIAYTVLIFMLIAISKNPAYAIPNSSIQISGNVGSIFAMEFSKDSSSVYNTYIPFTDVNPRSEYNYADGRAENDGKSDVGLIILTNQDLPWYLKIHMFGPDELRGKVGAYLGQPYNRNALPDGAPTTGERPFGDKWFDVENTPSTIYVSDSNEFINTSFGTIATLSFKINGGGVKPGNYDCNITYTLTTVP